MFYNKITKYYYGIEPGQAAPSQSKVAGAIYDDHDTPEQISMLPMV